jgi:hypothetical protein
MLRQQRLGANREFGLGPSVHSKKNAIHAPAWSKLKFQPRPPSDVLVHFTVRMENTSQDKKICGRNDILRPESSSMYINSK